MLKKAQLRLNRINDAVKRILKVKFRNGLFDRPIAGDSALSKIGSDDHRSIARQAVRESFVLLKNENIIQSQKILINSLFLAEVLTTWVCNVVGGQSIGKVVKVKLLLELPF